MDENSHHRHRHCQALRDIHEPAHQHDLTFLVSVSFGRVGTAFVGGAGPCLCSSSRTTIRRISDSDTRGKLALMRAYSLHLWITSGTSSGLISSPTPTPAPAPVPASKRRSESDGDWWWWW